MQATALKFSGPAVFVALSALVGPGSHQTAQMPTVAIVQAAYEREAASAAARHDKNLEIVAVDCNSGKIEREYLCWVTFTSKNDPAQTLYYDVAAVAGTETDWVLKSGLCRK
jgi:hypothetical protein